MTWKVTETAFSSLPDQGSKTMGPQLLFWLLGAALALPCTGALTCYKKVIINSGKNMRNQRNDLTTGNNITCEEGQACQESVLFTESGTEGTIVSSKGCAAAGITSFGPVTISAPGVTTISYTRVCSSDLCNDISSTVSILSPAPPAAPSPDGLQCPTCVALESSCSNTALSLCPNGTSRCYQGRFRLSGGGISAGLGIKGCAPKAVTGCYLLRKSWAFGPIAVTEDCEELSKNQSFSNRVITATTAQSWGMAAGLLLSLWGCLPSL